MSLIFQGQGTFMGTDEEKQYLRLGSSDYGVGAKHILRHHNFASQVLLY